MNLSKVIVASLLLAGCAGPPTDGQHSIVQRVIDGDTLVVLAPDPHSDQVSEARVRLIGVDAPESDECGGDQATQWIRDYLPPGTSIYIESDVENTDRYGRLLRYIYDGMGRLVNAEIISDGWAQSVVVGGNDRHAHQLATAEVKAREAHVGIWDLCDEVVSDPKRAVE